MLDDNWGPLQYLDDVPTPASLQRVAQELIQVHPSKAARDFIYVDEQNFSRIHLLLVGEEDSACAGGFFHFFVKFPHFYPVSPPRVRFLTTAFGKARFHDKLLPCGKVLIDELGTTLDIRVGQKYVSKHDCREVEVASGGRLDGALKGDSRLPPYFRDIIIERFLSNYDQYENRLTTKIKGVPFATGDGYNYKKEEQLARLRSYKEKAELHAQAQAENEEM
ncbi:hypothetical protein HPB52_009927 [Rhipicephalus sanguineus]|uniref:UBC core domain-containing protein n=1 Tax=Rhipicephalus sanguineus TaxID=34632 RepID=A0A9D4T7N7_RHISA|nr:hypothetical protein HPB52_009927 [Rhipicephalus sanguineus]